jgi:uncharacterized protein (TIGR02646 family)
MRPVNKGAHPLDEQNQPVVFKEYRDALPHLKDRIGRCCSYCERHIAAGLAVEHVVPKSKSPHLICDWDNMLLACSICNSHKRNQNDDRDAYLWPDEHDTFSAFEYSLSGAIRTSTQLPSEQYTKAKNLLALTGLDLTQDVLTSSDHRWVDRLERWGKAQQVKDLLPQLGDGASKCLSVAVVDCYSVWMTVFQGHPELQSVIRAKFPGNR